MWWRATVHALFLMLPVLLPLAGARADYVTALDPGGDNFLALRSGPGTSYRTIRRLQAETILTVLQRRGLWIRVRLEDGTEGWASGEYIAEGLPPGAETVSEADAKSAAEDEQSSGQGVEAPAADREAPGLEASPAEGWNRYTNARFGTEIEYPANLFRMLPPPENDDGRRFGARDGDAQFSVFGSHNVLEKTIAELLDDDIAAAGQVTYRRNGDDWYVLSGYRGDEVFYRKVILSDGGAVIHTFEMTYPKAMKTTFDAVTVRMAKSLKAGGVPSPTEEPEANAGKAPEPVAGAGSEVAPAPIFETWNTAACEVTDTAMLTIDGSVHVDAIELWYHWDGNERALDYTVAFNGQKIGSGTLERGKCDPHDEGWCIARAEPGADLVPGSYTIQTPQAQICRNADSGGQGFIRSFGSKK